MTEIGERPDLHKPEWTSDSAHLACSLESVTDNVHHLVDRPKEDFAQGNAPALGELLSYGGEGAGRPEANTAEKKPIKPHVQECNVLFIGYRAF